MNNDATWKVLVGGLHDLELVAKADVVIREDGTLFRSRAPIHIETRVPVELLVRWLIDPTVGRSAHDNLALYLGLPTGVKLVPLEHGLLEELAKAINEIRGVPATARLQHALGEVERFLRRPPENELVYTPLDPCPRNGIQVYSRAPEGDLAVAIRGMDEQEARDWGEVVIRVGADAELSPTRRAALLTICALADSLTTPTPPVANALVNGRPWASS